MSDPQLEDFEELKDQILHVLHNHPEKKDQIIAGLQRFLESMPERDEE